MILFLQIFRFKVCLLYYIQMAHEYVYLVQEREFIKTNENIYKIGRTKKENLTRFNKYPKGSALLLQLTCKDCVKLETELIKCFIAKYIQRIDIGREYFQGDYENMIEDIFDIKRKLFSIVPEILEVATEIPSMPNIKPEIQHQEKVHPPTLVIIPNNKTDTSFSDVSRKLSGEEILKYRLEREENVPYEELSEYYETRNLSNDEFEFISSSIMEQTTAFRKDKYTTMKCQICSEEF
jgi:hypothetical protein